MDNQKVILLFVFIFIYSFVIENGNFPVKKLFSVFKNVKIQKIKNIKI